MNNVIEAGFPWLSALIVIALLGSLALWAIKPLRARALPFGIGLSALLFLGFICTVIAFDSSQAATVQLAEDYTWIPQIGASIAWGVNGMGLVMIGLATFLVPIVLVAAVGDLEGESDNRIAGYVGWVLLLEAIMIGIFAARDVFLFYVLFEIMIIPVYFLIGRYGRQGAQHAAIKFVLYSLLGGLIMLIGVIALAVNGSGSQALLIDAIGAASFGSSSTRMWIFLTFFAAFAIKAPMFPVHTWLPDAAEQAPAGTSTLLVGVLDKIGTYGMIAICLPVFGESAKEAAVPIIILAVVSIFWGAFMALASEDLMRLVAYTSVSHFGFMIIGIFSGSSVAMSGAILYMVAHGVATGALFLTVGFLGKRGGDHRISTYGGWQRVTPVLAGVFLIAGLATIALPGLSGFVPEYMVLVGTFRVYRWAAIISVFAVIIAALYILLPYQRVFTGPKPEVEAKDLNLRERVVAGILVAAMLILGFAPGTVLDLVSPVGDQASSLIQSAEGISK